jgi:hypothetical protein
MTREQSGSLVLFDTRPYRCVMLRWLLVVGVALNACAQPIDAAPSLTLEPQPTKVLSADTWIEPVAIDVHVSERFADFRSDDYLAAIVGAAEQWNQATAGRVSMRVSVTDVESGDGVFIRPATTADVSADRVGGWSLGSTACVGCYPTLVLLNLGAMGQRSAQISVPVAQLAEYTAMHELGHVLGLGHTEQGLMYHDNTQGSAACIDAATLDAFCQLHGCPPEAHTTCDRH